jgi:hypothetical protein
MGDNKTVIRWALIATEGELIEIVAQAIHRGTWTSIAPTEEEYEKVIGYRPKLWKTDAPWDTNPAELAEHERDDYRNEAREVIRMLASLDGRDSTKQDAPKETP